MRLHLTLCLLCAVVSGKRTKKPKPTEQPTAAPVPTPAPVRQQTAASDTQATLLYENASCEGSDQGTNLGTPASVDECAASAADAGCTMFMFSASYGYAWGCRCCAAKTQYHNNWSIYSVDSKSSLGRTTPRPTTAPTSAHSCPTGYVADCEGSGPGGHCCPERWLGNGDCDDHYEFMKHCDLTCYDNDGGDCVATTPGPTPEPTPEPTLAPTLAPTTAEIKPVVRGSLTLSGLVSPTRSEPVLQDAVARVADVHTDAVTITGVRSVQRRRALRRRLEASTVVVDYEVEATNSETVARKLAGATPSVFDEAIQSAAAAAGKETVFEDVKTEELSAESADSDEDDAPAAKTASVTLIASVTAGICCLAAAAVMVKRALLARRGKKKTPAVVEPELPRGAAVVLAYAQPLASIKERAMVEVAHTAGENEAVPSGYGGMGVAPESEYGGMGVIAPEPSQEGEYDPEC